MSVRVPVCGSPAAYRLHLARSEPACAACEDRFALDTLERQVAQLHSPADQVRLSALVERRRELAALPLIGPRIAAGFAESV